MSYVNGFENSFPKNRAATDTIAEYHHKAFDFQNADRFGIYEILKGYRGRTLAERLAAYYLKTYTDWSESHIQSNTVSVNEPNFIHLMPQLNGILLSRSEPDAEVQIQRWRIRDNSIVKFVDNRCLADGVF